MKYENIFCLHMSCVTNEVYHILTLNKPYLAHKFWLQHLCLALKSLMDLITIIKSTLCKLIKVYCTKMIAGAGAWVRARELAGDWPLERS